MNGCFSVDSLWATPFLVRCISIESLNSEFGISLLLGRYVTTQDSLILGMVGLIVQIVGAWSASRHEYLVSFEFQTLK